MEKNFYVVGDDIMIVPLVGFLVSELSGVTVA